ncbi:hypothetical protein AGMMS50276_16500 [Synergistales bacterium]|nr:hypothetical protein AGMMS50276_16500 [Synergistales bacterium]
MKLYFSRAFVLVAAFLGFVFPAECSAMQFVSLERYLEIVRDNNHSLRAGIKNVEAAYYSVRAAVSYQRPRISASGSASYLTDQETGGSHNKNAVVYNTTLGLSQRISLAGEYTLDEKQLILSYEAQRAAFENSVNTFFAMAEENYWAAVLARENVALQVDVLRQRLENNRVTEEKFKQQLVPKLDLIRSEAQVVAAESLVTEAQAQHKTLLATLASLAGGTEIYPIGEPLIVPKFSLGMELDKAILTRPDTRSARVALERSKTLKKLAAKGLSPTLSATIGWTPWSDPWNSSTPQKGEFGASLTLNIPLTDGNETKYNTLNADRLVQAAEATLKSVENTARLEMAVALNNWDMAESLEKAKKRQVERSDEELRITELMYNEGMGAQIDLINAQTENQQVRTEYLNAVRGMYIALVQLRRSVGDYAPNEEGTWKKAVIRYGKGNDVPNEMSSINSIKVRLGVSKK